MSFATCMPVSPRHADKLGFLSIPLSVSKVSEVGSGLLCLNLAGASSTQHQNIATLKENLDLLGVGLNWSVDLDYKSRLLGVLSQKWSQFRVVNRPMRSCSCGHVSMPDGFYNKTKNSATQGDIAKCCGTKLTLSNVDTLEMTFSAPDYSLPEVYPQWAGVQLRQAIEKLYTRGCVILSKRYDTGLNLHGVSLDNDLFWMFNLQMLDDVGLRPNILISGVSTIHQVALVYLAGGLKNIQKIMFLPRISFQAIHGVDTLAKVVDRFGSQRVCDVLYRLALSGKQVVTLSGSMFNSK